jgi:hypothetical protein
VGALNRRPGRTGAAVREAVLSNDLFEEMLSLRERDREAFDALLKFARRVAVLARR